MASRCGVGGWVAVLSCCAHCEGLHEGRAGRCPCTCPEGQTGLGEQRARLCVAVLAGVRGGTQQQEANA